MLIFITWEFQNFRILGCFVSKIYLKTVFFHTQLFTWLDVPMATRFWQPCFSNFFLPFVKKSVSSLLLHFLNHFNLDFLIVLVIFESIWTVFWGFRHEIKKSEMADSRWRLGRINHVMDLTPKWLLFKYSFVCIQISPSYLVLKLQNQKNILPWTRQEGLIWMQTKEY